MSWLEIQNKLVQGFLWASGIEAIGARLAYQKKLDAAQTGWRNLPKVQRHLVIGLDPELQRLKKRADKASWVAGIVSFVVIVGVVFATR